MIRQRSRVNQEEHIVEGENNAGVVSFKGICRLVKTKQKVQYEVYIFSIIEVMKMYCTSVLSTRSYQFKDMNLSIISQFFWMSSLKFQGVVALCGKEESVALQRFFLMKLNC